MDAIIKEGNVGRSFSPVDKLKINLQNDGGESLWVPEDSVQLDELYTSTNGTYYAAPRDIYGWGVVTVDVDNSVDEPDDLYDDDEDQEEEPEGNWYFIDPDTDDRVDIEEDENGWYFIDPDTGDRVDIEEDDDGWYFIDPDTGERVDIEEDEDGDPYFIDPETGERVDIDWDGEGEKPDNPWSPHSGGGGGGDEDQDDDSWDDWDDDPDEDWNEDGDEGDEEDWDEEGDDEDDGITDGDEYGYIDDDGNLVEGDCPASIKIMHTPNKTEYTDGLAIDYDGLVVQAFDADGNVWTSPEYPDGYIPAHQLNVPQYADISATEEVAEISDDYDEITQDQINKIASPESVANMFSDDFGELSSLGASEIQSKFAEAAAGAPFCYAWCDGGIGGFGPRGGAGYTLSGMWCGIVVPVSQSGNILQCVTTAWDASFAYFPEGVQYFNLVRGHSWRTTWPLFAGTYPWGDKSLKSSINADTTRSKQNIDVGFTSPCLTELTATLSISVSPKEDHNGSHQSGKF